MKLNHNFFVLPALLLFVFSLAACAGTPWASDNRKSAVENQLQGLEQGLKLETWDKVRDFFSPGYYEGYEELRQRLENRWRNENLVDIRFMVNKVLESDGLLNASVRWQMSYLDRRGNPHKRSGQSEILLKPAGDSFRILQVKGDRFF
ncbi:MAG: hypothetical protein L3J03_00905 [Desulfobacterales bacterium]|nr:hypothetical protein [Desulfobacterales bacterium]